MISQCCKAPMYNLSDDPDDATIWACKDCGLECESYEPIEDEEPTLIKE